MEIFYQVCQWLLIVAFIGFFAAIGWIVFTLLAVKNAVMTDAKRLYEPPLRSGKAIVATGKGIFLQEKVRFQRVGTHLKGTANSVKDTASNVKNAAQSIHPSDLQPVATDVKYLLNILGHVSSFIKAVSNQGH